MRYRRHGQAGNSEELNRYTNVNQTPKITNTPPATPGKLLARVSANAEPGRDLIVPGEVLAPVLETGFETPRRIGLMIAFIVFGLFGVWSVLAPIEGSVHAVGTITVKSYNSVIQHLEGGIVKEIRVQNGDAVDAGEVLLVMDSTQPLAQLEIATGQLISLSALEARLLAERDDLDSVVYPPSLQTGARGMQAEMATQSQIFRARKAAREGAIAVLSQRIGQLESRIVGLQAVRASKNQLASSYAEELTDTRALLAEGFSDKLRLRELERNHALLTGEAAEMTATIAQIEIQMGETELEIIQLNNEFLTEVVGQLAETQNQLKDIRERVNALTDIVARTEVRAPVSGVVNGLQFHTIGGVIGPGTPIAEIVPQSSDLIVEAWVMPVDIDRVAIGQETMVRLPTFNSRTVPTLYGNVLTLSADAMTDEASGRSYYVARVELNPESMDDLEGVALLPGMPAEVFITTPARTLMQYMLKPLTNSMARAFIED